MEIGLNVVDIGKILQTKPSREKRLVYYQLEPPMTLSKVYDKKKPLYKGHSFFEFPNVGILLTSL